MKKIIREFHKQLQKKSLKIDKRIRFVISAIVMGVVMLIGTFFPFEKALFFIPVLASAVYLLTYFSLIEGIGRIGWFGLFIMPVLASISFYLFYFLFPGRWLTRITFIFFYEITIYALIVCSNIFNIGVEKSLGLYRAAFSINFLYQAVVSYLIYSLVFAYKSGFLLNGLLVGAVSLVMSLNLLWTIRLKKYLENEVKDNALLISLIMAELGIVASFVPMSTPAVYALFLTGSYYSLAGLVYNRMDEKLFKETVREYLSVFLFVVLITILSLSW